MDLDRAVTSPPLSRSTAALTSATSSGRDTLMPDGYPDASARCVSQPGMSGGGLAHMGHTPSTFILPHNRSSTDIRCCSSHDDLRPAGEKPDVGS